MALLSLWYVVWRIRHSKMQIEYAIFWIVLGILGIVMASIPETIYFITRLLGMQSPANVVYLFIIAILLLKTFMLTIELSSVENKLKDLVQQIALYEKEHNQSEE